PAWACTLALLLTLACAAEDRGKPAVVGSATPAPPPGPEYEARAGRALTFLRESRVADALNEANKALRVAPLSAEPYRLFSTIYSESDQDPAGIEFFREQIERRPGLEHPWYAKGVHEFRLSLWDQARASFGRVIEIDPGHADGRYFLARILLTVDGDFEAALEHLRIAHEFDPRSERTALELEFVLRIEGRYEEAGRVAAAALEMLPNSAELHQRLALLRIREGDDGEAEELLRAALERKPGLPTAHRDLGRLLLRNGRENEGRESLARARRWDDYYRLKPRLAKRMRQSPRDPRIPLLLAELELAHVQLEDALAMYRHCEALGGPADRIAAGRAWVHLYLRQIERADVELAKIVEWDDPRADAVRAGRLIRSEELPQALRLLDRAAGRAPAERTLLHWISDLYGFAGNPAKSAELLLRAGTAPAVEEVI
nr:tetratricopeptide repeat protein [Acidobacteriota bacterium]